MRKRMTMLRLARFLPVLAVAAVFVPSSPSSAATCADYSNQAAAQAAKDTRDADSDGIYCESLPCPCSRGGGGSPAPKPTPSAPTKKACTKTGQVQPIGFNRDKYPNIRAHYLRAVAKGWPRTLVVNRKGADARRKRLLRDIPTRPGRDRDEYPPAVGRGRGAHLVRGMLPRGWMASVAYVPSSENRSHGSTLGIKLRRFCDGQKFKYVFF